MTQGVRGVRTESCSPAGGVEGGLGVGLGGNVHDPQVEVDVGGDAQEPMV